MKKTTLIKSVEEAFIDGDKVVFSLEVNAKDLAVALKHFLPAQDQEEPRAAKDALLTTLGLDENASDLAVYEAVTRTLSAAKEGTPSPTPFTQTAATGNNTAPSQTAQVREEPPSTTPAPVAAPVQEPSAGPPNAVEVKEAKKRGRKPKVKPEEKPEEKPEAIKNGNGNGKDTKENAPPVPIENPDVGQDGVGRRTCGMFVETGSPPEERPPLNETDVRWRVGMHQRSIALGDLATARGIENALKTWGWTTLNPVPSFAQAEAAAPA